VKIIPLLLIVAISVAGCQSEAPAPEPEAKKETSVSTSEPESKKKEAAVEVGMSMADVKKIKGAPKETKHAHGPNDAELDLWVYTDQTVKFQDGKVVD
jgi:PBP1b-binding outer membrane lipoprotein LpoB